MQINKINQEIIKEHYKMYSLIDNLLEERAYKKKIPYFKNLVPMFYNDFIRNHKKILFIGINPSFNYDFHKWVERDLFNFEIFKNKSDDEQLEIINQLIEVQNELKHGYRNKTNQITYFKTLDKFSNNIGYSQNWDHYDLFPIRCTNQKIFNSILNESELENFKSTFINLFLKIIEETKYDIIYILNKDSSKFIFENLKELQFIKPINGAKNSMYGLYSLNRRNIVFYKHLSGGATSNIEMDEFIKFSKNI